MQENNLVSTPVSPEAISHVLPERSKQSNSLTILLSVLLFISVLISGFFAYQTQNLTKELTSLKNEKKVVAIATTEPTVEPIATGSSTIDPTLNWKTYKNLQGKFTFKYPANLFLTEDLADQKLEKDGQVLLCTSKVEIKGTDYLSKCTPGMQILYANYSGTWGGGCPKEDQTKTTIDGKEYDSCGEINKSISLYFSHPSFYPMPFFLAISSGVGLEPETMNQIISTFRFTN